QRISVRRHARLVDYLMHDGCNARAWLFIWAGGDLTLKRNEVQFLTGYNNVLPAEKRTLTRDDLRRLNIRPSLYEIFEPMGADEIRLFKAHSEIHFYTWDDFECCLPRGSTRATLRDEWVVEPPPKTPADEYDGEPDQDNDKQTQAQGNKKKKPPPKPDPDQPQPKRKLKLKPGDVLIFEEVISPTTGEASDADRKHRHAVRLIKVTPGVDPLRNQPVVEIEWAEDDALPFPLCLSAVSAPPECTPLDNISVARGNVILVDHGRTIEAEDLGVVPTRETQVECGDTSCTSEVTIIPGRFNPRLKDGPLTFSQPLPAEATVVQPATDDLPDEDELVLPVEISAQRLLRQDPRLALPQIDLRSRPPGDWPEVKWSSRNDLLSSGEEDDHFVAEMDNFGRAHLRFGDGEVGRAPLAGERFTATYRVGNGTAGNVGAEAISHILLKNTLSGVDLRPRNPMPAVGGTEPEPMAEVKLFAPYAFRSDLQRAVTAEDYATIAQRHPKVQRAAATLRWTGGWYEARVAVDPKSKVEADEKLLQQVAQSLRRFRRIGHELKVVKAVYVPLEIEMTVCVKPGYLRGHIKAALLDRFSNRLLIDGALGFFHPDSLTFGDGVLISKLVATAQSVTGVENVVVTKLQRYRELPGTELEDGILKITPLEIARLDNDPDFPENGTIKFNFPENGRSSSI
ncbi:MAG: putative baseplate assembly protein, partial [Blastocatellia bacterium]